MRGRKLSEETKKKIKQSLMGHIVKQSTKQKISNCHRGKPRPCTEAKRISIANARKPEGGFPSLISPSGQIFHIDILSDFCREHNLHLPTICGLIRGYKNVKSHKGWRLS